MLKIIINGISGKMGQEVYKEINSLSDCEVVCGVDKNSDNRYIPVYDDVKEIKEEADIIIDFSTPEGTLNILEYAKKKSIPVVIATTGFNSSQMDIIKNYSKSIPIFYSSNMSFEVNVMCEVVSSLAKKFNDSDIEIIETHHRNKVDSPSGTALMLANSINESLDNSKEYVYDRHCVRQRRNDKEIGIHSVRGGTVVGKHTVIFIGDNESFEITHNVESRNIFAKGAIKAAKYLVSQKNGLYNMKDLVS